MAIVKVLQFSGVGVDRYDAVLRELGLNTNNARWPKGVITHVAGKTPQGMCVVDFWESEADWQNFLTSRLTPAIEKVGDIPRPQITEFTVHNSHGITVHAT